MANATKTDLDNLHDAIEHLEKFLDPTNPGCTVPAEVRERARIYLDSWVAAPLREAVRHIENPGTDTYDRHGNTVWDRYTAKRRAAYNARPDRDEVPVIIESR